MCTPSQVQKYLNKISGPLLDRIDIQVEIVPVPFEELTRNSQSESSATIRERVIRARQMQEQRFAGEPGIHSNAQMTPRMLQKYAQPDERGKAMLQSAMDRLNLSARAYDRILKVARVNPVFSAYGLSPVARSPYYAIEIDDADLPF